MPFGPVDTDLDLPALEERVLTRWRDHEIVKKAMHLRDGAEPWVFYEGPPTANGKPGLHHVWARVFKDLYPRFQTMRGRSVPRKGGWDCHGLPVELAVEKELGLATKADVEAYGIEAFNQRCRESVQRYVEDWTSLTTRSGVWIDTADAYWTLTNDYIESVWWLVRQLWDQDLLYEGHRVTPYCGRCGTALSSHEVAQGYRDVVDPSVYVRFPVTTTNGGPDGAHVDADLLVWTTTPWTLISNVAAAVGADLTYVRITPPDGGRDLIMVAQAAERLYPDAPVHHRWTGAQLVGWRYRRPFDILDGSGHDAWRVVAGDFVAVDDGSGIVHLAPAFGEDDDRVAKAEGLPVLNPVDADAAFGPQVPRWQGRFVKDADREIIDDLDQRGLLVSEAAYEHSYPHCWRCDTPLIYWAKTSWFVRTAQRRDDLLGQNETINWHPEHIKHGRFGRWLEGNIDWALSRDRYWGTPLPIWRCSGCGHEVCVGSVAELSELAGRDLTGLDLHRPYVDDVVGRCPQDGCTGTLRRVPPVLDAWFDSGSMPSAQSHYPFDVTEAELRESFPADFICEAIDQTRGWFYSLLAVNTLVFGSTPYRNVVCLGHIVDQDGQKMSKSKGNVIDPWTIFTAFGSDALRWYFFASGQPWTPRRVFEDGIRESTRQTLLTLWNVFGFFTTYADLDGWRPSRSGTEAEPTHVLDRWVLSELSDTVATVTDALEKFDALRAASRLAGFVDDLSNWYVRRSRPRFWQADDPAAHTTLHRCLVETAKLLAPFCPFLADELYVTLTGEPSVHLADWPTDSGRRDEELSQAMTAARTLVALGRSARNDAKVKVRQPLRQALLLHPGTTLGPEVLAEVAAELNVKQLDTIDSLTGLTSWVVTPNFRRLGPRLGPKVNQVKAALADADGAALKEQLDSQGWVEVAGERLTADELTLRAERHESYALAEESGRAVALDLELDDELRAEGFARGLVRSLNDLRKEVGLEIADRISLEVAAPDHLWKIVDDHRGYITTEVLADSLERAPDGARALDVDGEAVRVTLTRS